MKETGIKRTAEGVFCENCGNDLSKDGSVKLIAHLDGDKFYRNHYKCIKCDAPITQEFERSNRWK